MKKKIVYSCFKLVSTKYVVIKIKRTIGFIFKI